MLSVRQNVETVTNLYTDLENASSGYHYCLNNAKPPGETMCLGQGFLISTA